MNEFERYLAVAAGKKEVAVGEDITVKSDLVISHDVTGPMAIEQFEAIGVKTLFDSEKVVFVLDHVVPAATPAARRLHNIIREFSLKTGGEFYGNSDGVIHQVVAEKHRLERGQIVVGADSHTCTAGAYGAIAIAVGATELGAAMATGTVDLEVPPTHLINLEGSLEPGVYAKDVVLTIIGNHGTDGFTDRAVVFAVAHETTLSMDEKMTIANMGIEMGAMITYFTESDDFGPVETSERIDLSTIVPSVAKPSSPGNVSPVTEVEGTPITQAVIGSCTNGRVSDMAIVAEVLEGRKIDGKVTLIVVPASVDVAERMEAAGYATTMRRAGAMVTAPGCGPCFGGHLGLLDSSDVAISSTNRNFPGRMGHKDASIYLASPRTVAESAVSGKIVTPGTVTGLKG